MSNEPDREAYDAAEEFIRDVAPDGVDFVERQDAEPDPEEGDPGSYDYDLAWEPPSDTGIDFDAPGDMDEDERKFYEYIIMDLHESCSELVKRQNAFVKYVEEERREREGGGYDPFQAMLFGLALGMILGSKFSP